MAQNRNTAEVLGTVTDQTAAMLPGVHVTVTNVGTQTKVHVETTQAGNYDVPFLQPGTYSITFERASFQSFQRAAVVLTTGQTLRIDASLPVGETKAITTVTAAAPLVDTDDSQHGTPISTTLLSQLPNVGRDPTAVATLAAGTSSAQALATGSLDPGRRNVNGNRAFNIDFTVNGGSTVAPASLNFSNTIPAFGAVSEVQVIQNNFSSEFGSGSSVLSLSVKSGTNQFHGMLFDFLANNVLNARNFFAKSNTPLRYNQFGGNIGGPVLKDRLFFFFSYQNTLSPSTSIGTHSVPSQYVRSGDFTGYSTVNDPSTGAAFPENRIPTSRIDPVAAAVQNYWPLPNQPGTVNNYYYAVPFHPEIPVFDATSDYYISQANQINSSFHLYKINRGYTPSIPGPACWTNEYCGLQSGYQLQGQISERWTISPNAINQVRANVMRAPITTTSPSLGQNISSKVGLKNVPDSEIPTFTISGSIPVALGSGIQPISTQNVFSYSDHLTWVKGRHSLKFGGELIKYQYNAGSAPVSGSFGFSGLFTSNGYADFLLGLPSSYGLNLQTNELGARRTAVAGFIQDDYHVRSNLTVNIGLRYQFEGGFSEAHNRQSNFDPQALNPITGTKGAIVFADSNNRTLQEDHTKLMAPRVGLAWSVRPNWVIRAGYGIFIVPISGSRNFNTSPPGYAIRQNYATTDLQTPIFQLSSGPAPYQNPDPANRNGGILNGQPITYWPYHAPQAYVQQWHFNIQRQIGAQTMVQISYVGNRGTHLLFPRDLNQVPAQLLGPGNAQLNRPYVQYQGISAQFNDASSSYNAFQFEARRTFANGFTFLSNYTFSKSLDNSSLDLTTGTGSEYQIAGNPSLSRALSQFDQKHRVVFAYVYELPFGKGRAFLNRSGIINSLLGGWQTSGTLTANGGFPFSVYEGGPNTSNSLAGSLFPNRISNGNLPSGQQSINGWFNTGAFSAPALYTFGNSGRDILRGPNFWNLDFSLKKQFAIPMRFSENSHIEFRADFANVLNHANFGQPGNTTGSAAFGTITSAYGSRSVQLGLQWLF